MDQQNRFPKNQFPPTNLLAAAIKNLPTPGPNVSRQEVVIDAGPVAGRYRVMFIPRLNPDLQTPTWFWGVESGERIPFGQVGAAEELPQDPD